MSSFEVCHDRPLYTRHHAVVFSFLFTFFLNAWLIKLTNVFTEINIFAESVFVWLAVYLIVASPRQSIVIFNSSPPALVRTRQSFGIFQSTNRTPLHRAAWVQIKDWGTGRSPKLIVEIGSHDYLTTTVLSVDHPVLSIPEAERTIEELKTLCTRVADFLQIEDKGFPEEVLRLSQRQFP